MDSAISMTASAVAANGLPAGEMLSGIFGSISMTAWICLLLPQLITNYKAKSAEALSVLFLIVWFLGDVSNFIGALLSSLPPSAIALAGYFCVLDVALISQTLYYNSINSSPSPDNAPAPEHSPLLADTSTTSNSHYRSTDEEEPTESQPKSVSDSVDTPGDVPGLRNCFNLVAVYIVGFLAWYVSYRAGLWGRGAPGTPDDAASHVGKVGEMIGLVLGYVSAACYLVARLPQISKNYKAKSCEGLSLLFFMLSTTGNIAYAVSLAAFSQDKHYLVKTIPWFLGSLGTVGEDCIIFVQFRLYAHRSRHSRSVQ